MMAPSLAGSPRVNGHRDYVINVLLKGMTGPLGEGSGSSADIMLPMGSNTDAWVAGIASYVRASFGNAGGLVTPGDVARVRAATLASLPPPFMDMNFVYCKVNMRPWIGSGIVPIPPRSFLSSLVTLH
jgi:hypothetical protein